MIIRKRKENREISKVHIEKFGSYRFGIINNNLNEKERKKGSNGMEPNRLSSNSNYKKKGCLNVSINSKE